MCPDFGYINWQNIFKRIEPKIQDMMFCRSYGGTSRFYILIADLTTDKWRIRLEPIVDFSAERRPFYEKLQ